MFRIRRYRIFLTAAVLTVATVYYLSRGNNWNVADLENLKSFKFNLEKSTTTLPIQNVPRSTTTLLQRTESTTRHSQSIPSSLNDLPLVQIATSVPLQSITTTASKVPIETPATRDEEVLQFEPDEDEEFGAFGEGRAEGIRYPTSAGQAHWVKPEEHFPVPESSLIHLPTGQPKPLPPIQYTFPPESVAQKSDRLQKQSAIVEAFQHAWNGYKTFAMGHDELRPISNKTRDPFMGWGATLVDSLDTLWIMGLTSEFEEALTWVKKIDFTTSTRKDIPLFETTIRYLGGLLSAYDLSSEMLLLDKAVELAEILIGAFDTPNRMPQGYYNWAPSYTSQPHRADSHMVMSELGSLSMEFTRLAQITKEAKYYDAIARVTNALQEWQQSTSLPGLWPIKLDASGCRKVERRLAKSSKSAKEHLEAVGDLGQKLSDEDADDADDGLLESVKLPLRQRQVDDAPLDSTTSPKTDHVDLKKTSVKSADGVSSGSVIVGNRQVDLICEEQGLGHEPNGAAHIYSISAMADSTYEYLPKMYALLGGLEEQYMTMYDDASEVIRKELLYRPMTTEERDILFPAAIEITPSMKSAPQTQKIRYEGTHLVCFVGGMFGLGSKVFGIEDDMGIAKKLTDGCVWSYDSTPTGIMPEAFELLPCPSKRSCTWDEAAWYDALDPEEEARTTAVEKWNANQKVLWDKKQRGSEERVEINKVEKRQLLGGELPGSVKIPEIMETPTKILALEKEEDLEGRPPSPPAFVPKVALSHEKYARARVNEERLPPGYTKIKDREYKLRPEAIESVFIMYRLTGEEYWRQKGWEMFESVQSRTLSEYGNAALKDVTSLVNEQNDIMESFWLAETLKYYYLLISEPSHISLDDYVFNTEAHPFKLPK